MRGDNSETGARVFLCFPHLNRIIVLLNEIYILIALRWYIKLRNPFRGTAGKHNTRMLLACNYNLPMGQNSKTRQDF